MLAIAQDFSLSLYWLPDSTASRAVTSAHAGNDGQGITWGLQPP